MEKKTVSRKLYIITVIILLISAGYLGSGWRESMRNERIAMSNFEMVESTLSIAFPDDTLFYKIFDTSQGSPRGEGDTLRLFIIPPQSMEAFEAQLKQMGWIEYTSDMFDTFAEEYYTWKSMYHEEIPLEDFTHGYAIFMGDGKEYYDEPFIFYDSDGSKAYTGNEAMLFYDTVTGRLYFYTHTS